MILRIEIQKEFAKFYKKAIPEIMKIYGTNHSFLIGEVFLIERESKQGLLGKDGKIAKEGWTFPLAKVYNVGTEWKGPACVPGDIIRLKDYDALSKLSKANAVATDKNEFANSPTTTRVGAVPAKYINLLWETFDRRIFCPDPFEMDFDAWDGNVFFFDLGNVLMPLDKEAIALLHPHGRIE